MEGMHRYNPPGTALSPQQARVLSMVSLGKMNKEIASKLGIAEGTVKQHLTAAYRKLGVTNRTGASMVLAQGDRGTACPIKDGLLCRDRRCAGCALLKETLAQAKDRPGGGHEQ